MYNLESIDCPVCGSSNNKVFLEKIKEHYNNMDEYFNIVECRSCSMKYTNPRPTLETIDYFYPDNAAYYLPNEGSLKHSFEESNSIVSRALKTFLNRKLGYKNFEEKGLLSYLLGHLMSSSLFISGYPPRVKEGKLLDIGCSWGRHLYLMKSMGWNVRGIELNDKAAEKAKELIGKESITTKKIENTDLNQNDFDVVNMSMVLEHLHNPRKVLSRVNSLLKKDGLLIVSVPNIDGFEVRLHKEFAHTLHVPGHLNHFSKKTISTILEKEGFKVEKIFMHRFERDFLAPFNYKKSFLSAFFHNKLIRKALIRPFVWFMAFIGLTSRMTVYCRKV